MPDQDPLWQDLQKWRLGQDRGAGDRVIKAVCEDLKCIVLYYLHYRAPAEVDDVLQTVFVRILNGPGGETNVRAWARTIAKNLALDVLRKQQRHGEVLYDPTGANDLASAPVDDHEETATIQEEILNQALSKLGREDRELVAAYYATARGERVELAEKLGMTIEALRQRIARTIARLRCIVKGLMGGELGDSR